MKRIMAMVFIGVFLFSGVAFSTVITSQVGVVVSDGTNDPSVRPEILDTLTAGMINTDFSWVHSFLLDGDIISAWLEIDLIDVETDVDPSRTLDLYAGTDISGTFLGSAVGVDQDLGGIWLDLDPAGNGAAVNNVITIDSSLYADLSDGTFEVFGYANSIGNWGSNRAVLTIETAPVPEPATMLLLGMGLIGLTGARRKMKS